MTLVHFVAGSTSDVLERCIRVAERFEADTVTVKATANVKQFNFPDVASSPNQLRTVPQVKRLIEVAEANKHFVIQEFQLSLRDKRNAHLVDFTVHDNPSTRIVNAQIGQGSMEQVMRLLELFNEHFPASAPTKPANDPTIAKQIVEARTTAARTLEDAAVRFANLLADGLPRYQSAVEQSMSSLDKRAADLESQLRAELEKDRARLRAESDELERRRAEFDAREPTAVRRELLDKLQVSIAEAKNVRMSKPTNDKRSYVHGVAITFLLGFGASFGFLLWKLLSSATFDWHVSVPFGASSLAFAATAVWYLRWNDSWFREHATLELHTLRERTDVLRANWLAEVLLEWDREKASPFPTELIQVYSKGLFEHKEVKETDHPVDSLAKLVNSLTKVQVDTAGALIEKKAK